MLSKKFCVDVIPTESILHLASEEYATISPCQAPAPSALEPAKRFQAQIHLSHPQGPHSSPRIIKSASSLVKVS